MTLKDRLYRLLRFTERFTKTDMVYLASGGFWLTLGQAISSLSAFGLAVGFANLVPPETYGTYKYILSIAGIFSLFTLPGINTAVSRAAALGKDKAIHSASRAKILTSLFGSILLLGGSYYYFFNGNIELSISLLVVAVTLPIFDTFTTYLGYLGGKKLFRIQTSYHAVTQVISVAVLVTTMLFTADLVPILLAYFIPLAVTRYILFLRVTRSISVNSVNEDESRETVSYGKHLTIMQILGTVAGHVDKILLWKFTGPLQLAIYTFALAIPEQLKGPLKGVGDLAFPKFASQTPDQVRTNMPVFWRKFFMYAGVLVCVSVIYILLAPFIYEWLFPQYLESIQYSQIFALSLIAGASILPITLLESQKMIRAQYALNIVHPVVHIALLTILIPTMGILGAIYAYVISRFVTMFTATMLVAYLFRRI